MLVRQPRRRDVDFGVADATTWQCTTSSPCVRVVKDSACKADDCGFDSRHGLKIAARSFSLRP